MAIRIRWIDGHIIALCAARTKKHKGDIYLDDAVHEALATKFAIDWDREGFKSAKWANPRKAKLMKKEESKEA
ncbi:unnamed protein product [marine sediment metagenome]|uniref:Uncharacterized protein n=1 Tax=marine sediment metagenome TaxID=412755 RepID=X1K4V5_9ZZZZ